VRHVAVAVVALLSLLPSPARADIGKPWQVAVRVKVIGEQTSLGSGTVVASGTQFSYILTCAHIFSEATKDSQIVVDLFDGKMVDQQVHYKESFQAKVIDFDPDLDVGLVVISPRKLLPAAPVVPLGWLPAQNERLVATGCGSGEDSIIWSTNALRLTRVGKGNYVGLECSQEPRQGRSGGGLHRSDGRVCGVLDFGSDSTDSGIYAAPDSIHRLLKRCKLLELCTADPTQYQPGSAAPKAKPNPTAKPALPRPPSQPVTDPALQLGQPAEVATVPTPTPPAKGFDASDPMHWVAIGTIIGILLLACLIAARNPANRVQFSPMATAFHRPPPPTSEDVVTIYRDYERRILTLEEHKRQEREKTARDEADLVKAEEARLRVIAEEATPAEAAPKA
jgi:hypothetical protein